MGTCRDEESAHRDGTRSSNHALQRTGPDSESGLQPAGLVAAVAEPRSLGSIARHDTEARTLEMFGGRCRDDSHRIHRAGFHHAGAETLRVVFPPGVAFDFPSVARHSVPRRDTCVLACERVFLAEEE